MASNLPAERGRELKTFLLNPNSLAHLATKGLVKPEVLVQATLSAMLKVPSLVQCSKESLLNSLVKLSHLGLIPDGREAAILPFGQDATAVPMYQGLMKLARKSGTVRAFWAAAVHERDTFVYRLGSDPTLEHQPSIEDDPGPIVAAYACAMVDGYDKPVFRVVPRRDIEKARKSSPSVKKGKPSPWDTWYEEMALKTAVLRLCKYLPQGAELQAALELEDSYWKEADDPVPTVDGPKPRTVNDLPADRDAKTGPVIDAEATRVPSGQRPDGQMECPNLGVVEKEKCSTCKSRPGCPSWD